MKKNEKSQKPLTLEVLAEYNQMVFLPALEEHFSTKKEFKKCREFMKQILGSQELILKKLDLLLATI